MRSGDILRRRPRVLIICLRDLEFVVGGWSDRYIRILPSREDVNPVVNGIKCEKGTKAG